MTDSESARENDLPHPTRRNLMWLLIQYVMQILFTVWLRYRARGTENVPSDGGALLLINHQSFLDPIIAGMPLRRPVSFLARENLLRIPVLGWVIRSIYGMPINRTETSTASMRTVIKRLKHGCLVGLFPEGTRTEDGSVGEFRPGFTSFIRRSGRPVIPVGIAGAFEALPRGAWWVRPGRVRVVFGTPFSPDDLTLLASRGREQQFIRLAEERVRDCQREAESWRNRRIPIEPAEQMD